MAGRQVENEPRGDVVVPLVNLVADGLHLDAKVAHVSGEKKKMATNAFVVGTGEAPRAEEGSLGKGEGPTALQCKFLQVVQHQESAVWLPQVWCPSL